MDAETRRFARVGLFLLAAVAAATTGLLVVAVDSVVVVAIVAVVAAVVTAGASDYATGGFRTHSTDRSGGDSDGDAGA